MIGKTFDDYVVIEELGRHNNNQHYRVKCLICGHEKECGISNLRKQDNHHSGLNCRYDYYKQQIGQEFGDYVCKSIEFISATKGYIATLECKICGHVINTHASRIAIRKHSAYVCEEDYHRNLLGNEYGDLRIIGIADQRRGSAAVYQCKCIKCGIESLETMAQLKHNIHHGTHCFKLLPNDEFKTAIFRRYNLMYQRCNNSDNSAYQHYGARGIKLMYNSAVDLYYDFIDELREHAKIYGLRNSTFDRIDVNGNYEKSNLRITHQKVQSTNTTRKTMFIIEKSSQRILSDSAMECGRYLNINGRSVGNVVRGKSKSCSGWTLYRIVDANENIEQVVNDEGVTTKLIVCDNKEEAVKL